MRFAVTHQPRTTIKAGTSATFTVRRDPADVGFVAASVRVISSDADEQVYNFRARGLGVSRPEARVTLDGQDVISNSATPVNLGSLTVGQDAVFTFTIDNIGSSLMTIGMLEFAVSSPAFVIVEQPSFNELGTFVGVTFRVRVVTDQAGDFASSITFTTNDGDENPFRINLIATVT